MNEFIEKKNVVVEMLYGCMDRWSGSKHMTSLGMCTGNLPGIFMNNLSATNSRLFSVLCEETHSPCTSVLFNSGMSAGFKRKNIDAIRGAENRGRNISG
jgi:hypothetical protein